MSGGLRHHSDEATGPESCGWIKRHRKKYRYYLEQTSASALRGSYAPGLQKQSSMYLDSADVVREMLKNSFARNSQKQNCARMPYKRLSQFSRHFASPKFWLFGKKLDFFNTHSRFHSL